jgi:hypothetical protein
MERTIAKGLENVPKAVIGLDCLKEKTLARCS